MTEPRDSGAMLGADGNLYPDPEGYTPSIVMILIAYKCQEQGVSASPWPVEQAFEEYKAEHGRFPKPEEDFAGAVRQWREANPGKTAIIDFLTLLQQTPENSPYQFPSHEKTFLNGINRGTYREPFANMQPAGCSNQALRFSLTTRLPAARRSKGTNQPWYCRAVAAADYCPASPGGPVKYARLNQAGQEVLRLPAAVTPRGRDPIPATARNGGWTSPPPAFPTRNGNAGRKWSGCIFCAPAGNIPRPPSPPSREQRSK